MAALYALILGVFVYREYGFAKLLAEVRGAMLDSAVIMVIIVFTSAFGIIMIRGQVATELADLLTLMTADPTILMLLLMVFWIVVGFFMAQTPAVLILTPILLPTATAYGIDLVHLGIIMSMTLTLGLLTPPVGMVLYALVRVTELPFERLTVVSLPYVVIGLGVILVLAVFPQLVLFLPQLLLAPGS